MKKIFFVIFSLLLLSSAYAIPQTFNIHGKLTDSSGSVLSGTHNMTFKIWGGVTGGSELWSSANISVTTDSGGVYNVILNEIDLDFSGIYYLGVTVGADSEMSPRVNLTSTPYTFRANDSDYLNGQPGTYYLDDTNETDGVAALESANVSTNLRIDDVNATFLAENTSIWNYFGSFYLKTEIEGMNTTLTNEDTLLNERADNLNSSKLWVGESFGGDVTGTYDATVVNQGFNQTTDLETINSSTLHLNQDNWYDDSNGWINWDGDSNEFNESKLSTIYYDASDSQAIAGTVDGGTLADTQHSDGNYDSVTFNFSEDSGSPGLDFRMNFTGIEDFNRGVIRYRTSSLAGDYPIIQLWSYCILAWEDYPPLAESLTFATITQPVFDISCHIQDEITQMRLYKASNGNTNNHYFVDWIAISKGYGTPSGEEIDPHSVHRDGTSTLTADWDAGDFGITAKTFNGSNLTIGTSATPANITMYSPDGTEWSCGVSNDGSWECSN